MKFISKKLLLFILILISFTFLFNPESSAGSNLNFFDVGYRGGINLVLYDSITGAMCQYTSYRGNLTVSKVFTKKNNTKGLTNKIQKSDLRDYSYESGRELKDSSNGMTVALGHDPRSQKNDISIKQGGSINSFIGKRGGTKSDFGSKLLYMCIKPGGTTVVYNYLKARLSSGRIE